MDAFGKEDHLWMLVESVSQCSIMFQMQLMIMCLKNVQWRNSISFKKNTGKVVFLQVKDLMSNPGLRNFCVFLYHASNYHFKGYEFRTIVRENDCVAILYKGTNWRFIFPWRLVNWHVLQIARANFLLVTIYWLLVSSY